MSSPDQTPRETMSYDVVVVGAGLAGLACAIRVKQLAQNQKREISVCVIEKGSEVGAHLLSGAAIEPRALDELFPNWKELGAPLDVPVTRDSFVFLTKKLAFPLPLAPTMHNQGNYIVSLGRLGKWLAVQAEALGVEIYPGFGGAEVLYDEKGAVAGVATGDVGIGKDGKPTQRFARGVELRAKQTVFAEGCRGSLTKMLMEKFKLSKLQSQAILDMKLQQLTGLERNKIEEEYLELIKLIEKLKGILADSRKVLGIIKEELAQIKEKYGDSRRTKILAQAAEEFEIEDLIHQEDVVVTLSHAGYVKRLPVTTYRQQRRGQRHSGLRAD